MKKLVIISAILSFAFVLLNPLTVVAQGDPDLEFWYSRTCPHCHEEHNFLDDLEDDYPDLSIVRHDISNRSTHGRLQELADKHGATQYLGTVPLTFIGDDFFVGFDSDKTTGLEFKEALGLPSERPAVPQRENDDPNTILGLSTSNYSLPALAIFLGFLDGFNVCSLGALVLILGLVMTLKSRKAIILYGSLFILTTAIIYGLLIFFWHQLFSVLSPYITFFQLLIAGIGIFGGVFFLREYARFRKYGVTCSSSESPFISRLSEKVRKIFEERKSSWALIGGVLLFAGILAIVEFPCSAAVPVAYAGLLATANLTPAGYISLIALFVLFYMLDELIVFAVAATKMKVWLTSPKFTLWAALIEGLLLLAFGLYYLLSVLGAF